MSSKLWLLSGERENRKSTSEVSSFSSSFSSCSRSFHPNEKTDIKIYRSFLWQNMQNHNKLPPNEYFFFDADSIWQLFKCLQNSDFPRIFIRFEMVRWIWQSLGKICQVSYHVVWQEIPTHYWHSKAANGNSLGAKETVLSICLTDPWVWQQETGCVWLQKQKERIHTYFRMWAVATAEMEGKSASWNQGNTILLPQNWQQDIPRSFP